MKLSYHTLYNTYSPVYEIGDWAYVTGVYTYPQKIILKTSDNAATYRLRGDHRNRSQYSLEPAGKSLKEYEKLKAEHQLTLLLKGDS